MVVQTSSVTAQRAAGRTLTEEEEIRSATARQAADRTLGLAGTQGRMTAADLSSAETAAPSEVMIEGARQGITATAGIKACPLREAGEVVEAA